jgi:PAS domain S-box-containing protein
MKSGDSQSRTFEVAPFGLWEWDTISNSFYFPNLVKQLPELELLKEEINFKDFLNCVHPADRELFQHQFDLYKNGGTPLFSLEHRVVGQGNSIRWILNQGNTIKRDEQGNLIRIHGLFKDITDQKGIEHNLNERLKELNCHNLISEIMGNSLLSLDEVIMQVVRVIPPAWQYPEIAVASIELNGKIYESEKFQKTEFGQCQEIISNGLCIGRIQFFYLNNAGFTAETAFLKEEKDLLLSISVRLAHFMESQQKSAALAESESKYKSILDASPDVITITDLEGRILFASPKVFEMFGHDRSFDYTGHSLLEYIHPDDHEKAMTGIAGMFSGEFSGAMEYRGLRQDGTVFYIDVNGQFIKDSAGNLIRMIFITRDISIRKATEEKILKLTRAVEQSPVSIVITNLNGDIEYANPKACETTGYELHELIGQNPRVLKSGETKSNEYNKLWNSLTSGNQWQGIFHNKRKNGELYWESSTISPIIDPNGKTTHYLAIKVDITEQKTAAENSRMQTDRLAAIVRAIPDLMLVTDDQGICLEYYSKEDIKNPVALDRIIGTNVRNMFDQKTSDLHILKLQECLRDKGLKTYDYEAARNGLSNYFETRMAYLDANKVLVFVRDITDKKNRDKEIQKLSQAVDQSPVTVVITDLAGNIDYVNRAFSETTGYEYNEVIGKNTNILKSGLTDRAVYQDLWQTIESGKEWRAEWINKRKSGQFYWEHISITPIHDESGNISNYLAIKQDISSRKKAEQEINDLNATLEQKIEERTCQLAKTNSDLLFEIEERKQIEEELKNKTIELENFFSVTLDLLCIADTSGKFIKVNRAWESILGYSTKDLENRQFLEFVHPDDIPGTLEVMGTLSEQNPVMNFINRYRTREGKYRFIEWHSVPVGDRIYAAARDITERKQAEEFENEMLQLSPQLTGLTLSEIDAALNLALMRIGSFLNADRTYIFEFNSGRETIFNSHEWCNEGIAPEIQHQQELSVSLIPNWMEALERQETIIVRSVKDLPGSWRTEREVFKSRQMLSVLVIPLFSENILIGFVGLDDKKKERTWSDAEIYILKVWGSMISSLLHNKKTELQLEQTHQNYETFFNTIDDFLLVVSEEGKLIHANSTVFKRLGFTMEDFDKESVMIVHSADIRDQAMQAFGDMMSGKTDFYSLPLTTKTGVQIPAEWRSVRGFWDQQPVIFAVGKDVSHFRLSEQKFSTAFHANSAMMAISAFTDGKYVDVNSAFLEVLNYSRDEIIGKTNKELGLFVDLNIREQILDSLDHNIPIRKLEVLFRTKGGEVKTGLLSGDSIMIGVQRCLLTVTMDITERKQAENEIREARLEAEQANLAKSEFLSRMSHELRTPMNSILGFAQLLERADLDPRQRKGVGHIMKSGRHLLDLINEILDLSRIEAGRLSLSLEPVQVGEIMREMVDTVRLQVLERQLTIAILETGNENRFVKADRQRLKQVLLNLLSNAIKYNVAGGSVSIKASKKVVASSESPEIRISVMDTGMGISEENVRKLFVPFERIGAEKTATEGTGLGLSVVKKLVEAMGGKLGVKSMPGEGSEFWVEFPVIESPLEKREREGVPSGFDDQLSDSSGIILYVEDNISNIELVDQILSSQHSNIRLITTSEGLRALPMALEISPDLILLDLNLPDIHGSEVLKLLKSEPATLHIPVVIISADAMQHQLDKLLKAGAARYLTKPLDITELLNTIDEMLKK